MAIKNSAIIYAGYDYQTLQGVRLLADWLNIPTKYNRIAFEADAKKIDAPQGIDDIVCERQDGKTDFWQVKFTPDTDKEDNQLSWEWLLKSSGHSLRSRSILQKIADAVDKVPAERRGNITLLTNKIPSREMAICLRNNIIVWNQVPVTKQQKIITQLGSLERAKQFFNLLQVHHSDQSYTRLNSIVPELLRKHTNEEGVYRLIERAKRWAIQRNSPSDDGWIYLEHIRSVISTNRPEPIPQTFVVPDNYIVPDADFHEKFIGLIFNPINRLVVLTGAPGKGKSTYISHICQILKAREFPYIRHHYFLGLDDRTVDRLSPRVVAEDLMSQVKVFCPQIEMKNYYAEHLHKVLAECGRIYEEEGKQFFVIIDGLDHVWRDNGKDKSPLDELFCQLLPLPDNVTLLVGTQPVDDELLPSRLLQNCPRKKWLHLPNMSGDAIRIYLSGQVESGRIIFNFHQSQYEEVLSQCAELLTTKTQGYPLYVIYLCEKLHIEGKRLSLWEIENLPGCEGGNITNYYNELWKTLSYEQRDILHLCCEFPFLWPETSFSEIFSESAEIIPNVKAVIHLLYESIAGLRPFHESLIVFIRSTTEHENRIKMLLPALISWLEKSAPEPIKNCWYWSCVACNGDPYPLRNGLTRDWILERLAEGYRQDEFIRLLTQAETSALAEGHFHEAYQHRSRKTRLLNARLQIWDMSTLGVCSMINASEALLKQYQSTQNISSPKILATLAIALWFRNSFDEAKRITRLALQRYSNESSVYTNKNSDESRADIRLLIKSAVLTECFEEKWLESGSVHKWGDSNINLLIECAEYKADIGFLFALHNIFNQRGIKDKIVNAIVRVGIVEKIDLEYWPRFSDLDSALLRLYSHLSIAYPCSLITEQGESEIGRYHIHPEVSYDEWFYESLSYRLNASGNYCWLPVSPEEGLEEVSNHFHHLNDFSDIIAESMALNIKQSFSDFCDLIALASDLKDHQMQIQQKRMFFKTDWVNIALNLHLIMHCKPVNREEINIVLNSEHTALYRLHKTILNFHSRAFESEAIANFLVFEDERQKEKLQETNEYLANNLELSEIALHYDLNQSNFFERVKLCWDYGLGYGHHKDISLNQALTAIETIATVEPKYALTQLERVSPLVDNICDFTDGDHTQHSVTEMSALYARLSPLILSSIYDSYVSEGEWYDADNALTQYLKHADLSSPFVESLCLTLLDDGQIEIVRSRIKDSSVLTTFWPEILPQKIDCSNIVDSSLKSVDYFEPAKIRPTDVTNLLNTRSGYDNIPKWYHYWKDQGKVIDLINVLLPIINDGLPKYSEFRYILSDLFEDTLRLKGKKYAFPILVQEHIQRNGWGEWGESDDQTYARLDKVAILYPDKIDDFICKTTRLHYYKTKEDNLVIPGNRLTYLLVKVGRVDEAKSLCEAMISELEAETRNLPLCKPQWQWEGELDNDMIAVKFIIRRLFWPVQCVKHLVAEQLSHILANSKRAEDIENLLAVEMRNRQLESEVVDILTVFWLASLKGYKVQNNISSFICARSFLSDILLESIAPNLPNLSCYQVLHKHPDDSNHYGFEKILGNDLPHIFWDEIKRLEDKSGIPAKRLMKKEWSDICHNHIQRWERVDYFFGSERDGFTMSFSTRNTRFGISAYLRTINRIIAEFRMPKDYAEHYSACLMSANPLFYSVSNHRPDWLPSWQYGAITTKENIKSYIEECLKEFKNENNNLMLGALSLPIRIDENNWLDITIVMGIQTEEHVSFKIQYADCGHSIDSLLQTYRNIEFSLAKWAEYKNCVPLLGSTGELLRIARWDIMYEFRGLFSLCCQEQVTAYPAKDYINFDYQGNTIGYSDFWQAIPLSIYPKDIRSPVATYTAYDKDLAYKWNNHSVLKKPNIMLCDCKVLKRENSYTPFETSDIRFHFESEPL
ncbi:NACHT domain-containing protein [Klebsiella pneumoniae]|uniref:NACHT domain-containing protein n=1 Tax=Klebsiella pneumoniae TaxID=573 RepID=UPI000BA46003|nr:NACHT domain-containing protein [Klebsiella pneumoniae]EKZ6363733.1 NACHT domain-containing protein [Klebsiella pneumoniae]EKZ6367794.1 NACHT domain-containing protein [Klebsiella pneumoniae]EKZ6443002.1 NACHT domain-containing protein [Klebsiella pneumoniae]EKZ6447018.1 NACHT domain-containing protein [Klebsiella pneumoniae]MBM1125839.1 NACHT domain-containing protein [Klebsiella pneumoniae]